MAAFLTPGQNCLRGFSHLPLKLYSNSIRCAPLAPGPAHRQHHVTYSPRWTSSPLRSSLSFWYTQAYSRRTQGRTASVLRPSRRTHRATGRGEERAFSILAASSSFFLLFPILFMSRLA